MANFVNWGVAAAGLKVVTVFVLGDLNVCLGVFKAAVVPTVVLERVFVICFLVVVDFFISVKTKVNKQDYLSDL